MSFIIDITPERTAFNDPNIYTCYIDGFTFTDAGVYQQHMMMYHGVSVDVRAPDNSIIRAPDNPVISQPIGTVGPGVILNPVPGKGSGYYTPSVEPIGWAIPGSQLENTKPLTRVNGSGNGSGSVSGSVSGWAMAAIIGAMLVFGARRSRRVKRTR